MKLARNSGVSRRFITDDCSSLEPEAVSVRREGVRSRRSMRASSHFDLLVS
jgi:hypothetical protein